MPIDVKSAVGVVVITVNFIGDIDGRAGQEEFVVISGTNDTLTIVSEIGRLKFNASDNVGDICGNGNGGFLCCEIEKSFFVTGADVKDFSFLLFDPSEFVFPYGGCDNEFTATVEYCGFDNDIIMV